MDTLRDKIVTTRKKTNCMGCELPYPAGSKLRFLKQAESGQIVNYHLCDNCSAVFGNIEYGDTFMHGDLWESWPENQGQTANQLRDKWNALDIAKSQRF